MAAENAQIVALRAKKLVEWEEGMDKGYECANCPLPNWFHNPYYVMSPWQRGFIFGRELALLEANEDLSA
jgi:hypothetical protein